MPTILMAVLKSVGGEGISLKVVKIKKMLLYKFSAFVSKPEKKETKNTPWQILTQNEFHLP